MFSTLGDEEVIDDEQCADAEELVCSLYGRMKLVCSMYGRMKLVCSMYGQKKLVCSMYGQKKLVCSLYGRMKLASVAEACLEMIHKKYKTKIGKNPSVVQKDGWQFFASMFPSYFAETKKGKLRLQCLAGCTSGFPTKMFTK